MIVTAQVRQWHHEQTVILARVAPHEGRTVEGAPTVRAYMLQL